MRALLILPVLLVGACGEEPRTAEEIARRTAEIERVNEGVALPVEPQRITYPDMERYDLLGPSCAFAPEGSMAPVALAKEDAAWMKVRGEMVKFAPDPGVQKGPALAWTKYDGREHSLRLGLGAEVDGSTSPTGKRYEGTLELRDGKDRTVFTANGMIQCS
jgi:hypothetical protein